MSRASGDRAEPGARAGGGSTAAVLWLMILLVFLPIAAGHAVAWMAESHAAESVK